MKNDDIDHLQRFIDAQQNIYSNVRAELKLGKKQSHWMWFIFPQIQGLGISDMAQHYAIKNIQEAESYLNHPVLGQRLKECSDMVFATQNKSITEIFGHPDDMKFLSCMTLFSQIHNSSNIFKRNIEMFYDNNYDQKTLDILTSLENQ